jgi:alpha-mannosidase
MTTRRRLVLVCNSHIDPVWLWPWEEGLAATLATFRAAADLCEQFDGFVFCHNEAVLYQWVEEYEPALFAHIQRLVRDQRWHIMGGWYLQPDCNLPSGESLVRQILTGRRYFHDRFGVEPRVAVNLDPFGHSRGLVQILRKSGYDGYLFCRPGPGDLRLPAEDFAWEGYDGSCVLAHRAADHYNSQRGHARNKAEAWQRAHPDRPDGLLLWGVGNHGGGPSREDLGALAALMAEPGDRTIVHGTPDDYFAGLAPRAIDLPRLAGDLNPWAVGCYTSMSTVKRAHRRLEHRYFGTERMLADCAVQQRLPYPGSELAAALQALLFCQFHDILPGSAIAEVETQALQRLHHGLDIVDRLRTRAFFALASGQAGADEGDYPILVYNPHPHPVIDTIVCEFQPPEPNFDHATLLVPELLDPDGAPVVAQVEKESCNIQMDQRKRLVFRAALGAACMTRYSCRLREMPRGLDGGGDAAVRGGRLQPAPARSIAGVYHHDGEDCGVEIDGATGLLTRYRAGGHDYLAGGAFQPLVIRDSADPWGMKVRAFRDVIGTFALMTPAAAATFAGVSTQTLPPVRVIEDGPVRTVVEALFAWERSAICLRYALPKQGHEVLVQVRVSWQERDTMLKLAVPTTLTDMRVRSEVAYGTEHHTRAAEELLGQTWLACVSADGTRALTIINDGTYGFDAAGSEVRVSCLRSPAPAGHPVDDVTPIVRQDRFEPRVDQGEHLFSFWLAAGPADRRLAAISREAAVKQDAPIALNMFPSGSGTAAVPGPTLSDDVVRLAAAKLSDDGQALILRLFEPTGTARSTVVRVPALGIEAAIDLGPFEIRTLAIDRATGHVATVDLLERPGA